MDSILDLADEPHMDWYANAHNIIHSFRVEGRTRFNIPGFRNKLIRLYQNSLKQIQKYLNRKKCALIYVGDPGNSRNKLINLSDSTQRELLDQLLNLFQEDSNDWETFLNDTGNKNKEFCKTYFQEGAIREGLVIFMNILFNNREPYELISRFNVLCCLETSHNDECKYKWSRLKEIMLKYLLNKD